MTTPNDNKASAPIETPEEEAKRLYPGIRFERPSLVPTTTETSDEEAERLYPGITLPPSLRDQTGAAARGTLRGALRDPPMLMGGVGGFQLGMKAALATAPVLGPFAGLIPIATTAGGIYAGYKAGQELQEISPQETDPRLMPAFEGGVTFGSALVSAPVTFGLPVAGPTANRLTTFLSNLGKTARGNPKAFLVGETAVAASMGAAGAIAEANYPGKEGVRFGAEMTGAILNPAMLFVKGIDLAKSGLSAGKNALSNQSARTEQKAVDTLLKILEIHGENPEELIKALRAQLPSSVPTPTAGQKTGSQALMDVEASLASHSAQFGGEIKKQGEISRTAYQLLIESLQRTGDPNALRAVAEMNKLRFDKGIQVRIEMAEANAATKFARIANKDTPEARALLGVFLEKEIELALGQGRSTENLFWNEALRRLTQPTPTKGMEVVKSGILDASGREITRRVPTTGLSAPTLAPSATITSFLERASGIGPAVYDEIPKPLRDIMASFGVDQNAVARYERGKLTEAYLATGAVPAEFLPKMTEQPIKNLVDYRSTLLGQGRKARASGDRDTANLLTTIADGMMRDLDTLQDPAYDQARQFSRSLNDAFTRTYANTLESTVGTGANRIAPEVLVEKAFSGGADQTALRMQEIEDAVGFMRTAYRDAVKKFGVSSPEALALLPQARIAATKVTSVRDAHNRILRLAAADALTPVFNKETGETVQQLNVNKLNKFVEQNRALLNRLGITKDLENATQAANLLSQVTNSKSILNLKADNQAQFGLLLTSESPTTVVTGALSGRFPVRDIKNLVNVAKKAGPNTPAALDGLKTTLLDYAYAKAGGNSPTQSFSVDAFEAALFDPIGRNQPSLVNIMRANGLMTLQEMSNLKKLITPMQRIETAAKNNVFFSDIIEGADVVTEFGLRLGGAGLGTEASKSIGGGGTSLIAASAGSKTVRQIFDAMPNATVRAVLENAVKDPEAMALLMRKASNAKEQIDIYNSVLNLLGSYGVAVGKKAITPTLNYLEAQEPQPKPVASNQPPFTVQGQAARQLRQLPVAPSTRGFPGMNANAATPKPAAPSSGPPTQANARAQYQALFPFDTVSPMVNNSNTPAQ